MFPVAMIAQHDLSQALHGALAVKTLAILLIHLLVAGSAIHTIPGLLSSRGMRIVFDLSMTV